MSYLYVKWNSSKQVRLLTLPALKHVLPVVGHCRNVGLRRRRRPRLGRSGGSGQRARKGRLGNLQLAWLMARDSPADFCYDLANCAEDDFLRDRSMSAIRDNDLPSARGEFHQFRLYFVNPHLLIRRGLPIQIRISKVERLPRRQHNQGIVSNC